MGKIIKVSGPLVVADGMADASMADVVRVGPQHLIGEILNMTGDRASIQVYEETSGLGPGAEVVTTGAPLSVELGPGLIENIYDGIQRPLEEIVRRVGANITRGIQVPPLSMAPVMATTAPVFAAKALAKATAPSRFSSVTLSATSASTPLVVPAPEASVFTSEILPRMTVNRTSSSRR